MPSIINPQQLKDDPCDQNLSRLPLEINHRIFSNFTLREVIECMRVCRLWRRCMVEWSIDHWKTIRFRNHDLDHLDSLLYMITSYVRQIAVLQPSQKSIMKVIDKLVSIGFTQIETFMIAAEEKCDLIPSPNLRLFSNHLTRLHIGSSRSNCRLLDVLACCPQLTHFSSSCYVHFSRKKIEPAIESPLRLQYLRLKHGVSMEELSSILRHSPHLRHIRLQGLFDFVKIVNIRPELEHLSCGHFPSLSQDPLWNMTSCAQKEPTPRTFEMYAIHYESPLYQAVALLNSPWGARIKRLVCEISKIFTSHRNDHHDEQQQQEQYQITQALELEHLEYRCYKFWEMQTRYNLPMQTLLMPLLTHGKQLKHLDIRLYCRRHPPIINGGLDSQAMPEYATLSNLVQLRHLCIHECNSLYPASLDYLFSRMVMEHTPLTSFEYMLTRFFPDVFCFEKLAEVPTLRHVTLYAFEPNYMDCTTVAVFTKALRPSLSIESLHFKNGKEFTYQRAFKYLSDNMSSRVKHLTFSSLYQTSHAGLKYLVEHHPQIETLRFIDIVGTFSEDMNVILPDLRARGVKNVIWEMPYPINNRA